MYTMWRKKPNLKLINNDPKVGGFFFPSSYLFRPDITNRHGWLGVKNQLSIIYMQLSLVIFPTTLSRLSQSGSLILTSEVTCSSLVCWASRHARLEFWLIKHLVWAKTLRMKVSGLHHPSSRLLFLEGNCTSSTKTSEFCKGKKKGLLLHGSATN